MAPTNKIESDMADPEVVARFGEHADRLRQHDERFNIYAQHFDKYDLLLLGDDKLNIKGMVESMSEMSEVVRDLAQWRKDMVLYAHAVKVGGRIILVFLGLIVGGVWWPQLSALIKLLGG